MTEPTDQELQALWVSCDHPLPQSFARAVLAKWGTPPAVEGEPVAWRQGSLTTVNQDPYPSLGDWFVQFWEGDDVAARVYGNDMETLRRRCAVIATPQPTQAQAWAVPLTDEMASKAGRALSDLYATECGIDKEDNWKVYGSDFIETAKLVLAAAHGIKGGQHGNSTT